MVEASTRLQSTPDAVPINGCRRGLSVHLLECLRIGRRSPGWYRVSAQSQRDRDYRVRSQSCV